ncbi:hypothetical protein NC653_022027 [Populus alba x Populus x berolinensis]|uniref:Uncharacterized protein n=1 Tax=Populus alba x Populus x berolinensis TaxID=444605 RepID=A0AAD6QFC1_9ROSI|nr:hypothetical protein NC653_022027 [Populus alba x Populus x berolinensis]
MVLVASFVSQDESLRVVLQLAPTIKTFSFGRAWAGIECNVGIWNSIGTAPPRLPCKLVVVMVLTTCSQKRWHHFTLLQGN